MKGNKFTEFAELVFKLTLENDMPGVIEACKKFAEANGQPVDAVYHPMLRALEDHFERVGIEIPGADDLHSGLFREALHPGEEIPR